MLLIWCYNSKWKRYDILIDTWGKKQQMQGKAPNAKGGILGGQKKGWYFISFFTLFWFSKFPEWTYTTFVMWKSYYFKNKYKDECNGPGKVTGSTSAEGAGPHEPSSGAGVHSLVLGSHSWLSCCCSGHGMFLGFLLTQMRLCTKCSFSFLSRVISLATSRVWNEWKMLPGISGC